MTPQPEKEVSKIIVQKRLMIAGKYRNLLLRFREGELFVIIDGVVANEEEK